MLRYVTVTERTAAVYIATQVLPFARVTKQDDTYIVRDYITGDTRVFSMRGSVIEHLNRLAESLASHC